MEKQANPFNLLQSANSVLNHSVIGSTFMNADLLKNVFTMKNNAGKLVARTHFNNPFSKEKKKLFNVPKAVTNIGQKGVNRLNKMSPGGQEAFRRFDKRWDQAAHIQGGIFMADLGASSLGLYGKGNKAAPARPAQQTPHNQKRNYVGQLNLPNKGQSKYGSMIILRSADMLEIPWLVEKCLRFANEFCLDDIYPYRLLQNRMLHQDTYISGDLMNLNGFINGGVRPLPGIAKKPYYIRIVYVNPSKGGHGIGPSMVEQVINKKATADGCWMQVNNDNEKMQKVASRLGFEYVDTWDNKGKDVGIWYRS